MWLSVFCDKKGGRVKRFYVYFVVLIISVVSLTVLTYKYKELKHNYQAALYAYLIETQANGRYKGISEYYNTILMVYRQGGHEKEVLGAVGAIDWKDFFKKSTEVK